MSQALQQMIRQAEIQKLQLELNVRFSKNLALFEKRMPKIFKLVKGKEAKEWLVRLDSNDNINLYNPVLKQFLYEKPPADYAQQQIKEFATFNKPRRFRIIKNNPYNDEHIHIPHLNAMLDAYDECEDVVRLKSTPNYLMTLLVTGVGLGFHLTGLIKKFDIQNIVIYEGNLDVFLASMQTIDWEVILDYFSTNNRTIGICIGVTPRLALAQMEYTIHNVGLFTMAHSFIYQHTKREEENEFINIYETDLRSFIGGIGYFDDEQIGLAHAYHNLKSDAAVFINKKKHERATPVLLIGNGPSLDAHEDYIKANKDKAVILSCGTALTSLLRMGIKPDFHVEMERCLLVKDVLDFGTESAQREGITLLCLHPVIPDVINDFDDACYGIKPNDAGGSLIHKYFEEDKLAELFYCNPTVSNCGLSFAISMGFEYIHLIGTDFGAMSSSNHHSKHSIYTDIEKEYKKRKSDYKVFKDHKATAKEGNFGGEVLATPVLDMARVSMERFLSLIAPKFPNLRVINSNNGAKIQGTEAIRIEDLPTSFKGNKADELASIKKDHFRYYKNEAFEAKDPRSLLTHFYSIEKSLFLKPTIKSDEDLYRELRRVFKLIHKTNDPVTHGLLKGSVNFFFTSIAEHTMLCAKDDERQARYALGQKRYNTFIEKVYEKMKATPFSLDNTHSKSIQLMKED